MVVCICGNKFADKTHTLSKRPMMMVRRYYFMFELVVPTHEPTALPEDFISRRMSPDEKEIRIPVLWWMRSHPTVLVSDVAFVWLFTKRPAASARQWGWGRAESCRYQHDKLNRWRSIFTDTHTIWSLSISWKSIILLLRTLAGSVEDFYILKGLPGLRRNSRPAGWFYE